MFKRLNAHQLAQHDVLPFDVYDHTHTLQLKAGQPLASQKTRTDVSKQRLFWFDAVASHVYHEGQHWLSAPEDWQSQPARSPNPVALPVQPTHRDTDPMATLLAHLVSIPETDDALKQMNKEAFMAHVGRTLEANQYLGRLRVHDAFTYDHTMDVAIISMALAKQAGLGNTEVHEVGLAALLHDLGKLMVPAQIMFKPGRLTEREFKVMKEHPALGYNVLKHDLKLPEALCLPALEHQEQYGGGGYPYNKQGSEIHLYSHIIKVADVFDALVSKRPYKQPIPTRVALGIMLKDGTKSFEPTLLATLVKLLGYTHLLEAYPSVVTHAVPAQANPITLSAQVHQQRA
jgi:HD-GYP domain-containing protein (c-di-GMP phosphodiesterase class II)